jgi:sugar lactone lactonase YvrE
MKPQPPTDPPQNILDARARLGEGPVWDAIDQKLLWVDVYNHRVHQFDPATGQNRYFDTGEVVSAIAPSSPDHLIIARKASLAEFDLLTGTLQPLIQLDLSIRVDTRCNDGKCDSQGRFWIGTVSDTPEKAALYRYDPDGSLTLMETGLTISNGLGWSPDGTTFYLTDSFQHKIFAYDFEGRSGTISNRRVLVDLSHESVEPDGLTIDTDGNIWSALWDGWAIACFAPTGQELFRIKMPVPRPTSVTFGGADLNQLYITSASVGLSQKDIQACPTAGDLFCLTTKAKGLPSYSFGYGSDL